MAAAIGEVSRSIFVKMRSDRRTDIVNVLEAASEFRRRIDVAIEGISQRNVQATGTSGTLTERVSSEGDRKRSAEFTLATLSGIVDALMGARRELAPVIAKDVSLLTFFDSDTPGRQLLNLLIANPRLLHEEAGRIEEINLDAQGQVESATSAIRELETRIRALDEYAATLQDKLRQLGPARTRVSEFIDSITSVLAERFPETDTIPDNFDLGEITTLPGRLLMRLNEIERQLPSLEIPESPKFEDTEVIDAAPETVRAHPVAAAPAETDAGSFREDAGTSTGAEHDAGTTQDASERVDRIDVGSSGPAEADTRDPIVLTPKRVGVIPVGSEADPFVDDGDVELGPSAGEAPVSTEPVELEPEFTAPPIPEPAVDSAVPTTIAAEDISRMNIAGLLDKIEAVATWQEAVPYVKAITAKWREGETRTLAFDEQPMLNDVERLWTQIDESSESGYKTVIREAIAVAARVSGDDKILRLLDSMPR